MPPSRVFASPLSLPFVDTFTRGDGAIDSPWLGGTNWSIVNNQIVNTPVPDADVIINGGFTADTDWTKAAAWTIAGGVAVHTPGSGGSISESVGVSGNFYLATMTCGTYVAGSHNILYGSSNIGPSRGATGTFTETNQADAATLGIGAGSTLNANFDNISFLPLPMSQLLNLIIFSESNGTAQVNITRTDGFQGGVAMNWDSPTYPRNGVIGMISHISANVTCRLVKFVDGAVTLVKNGIVTYVAGAALRIVKSATTYQMFYNNIQVSTNGTINDTGIVNNKYHGIFSTNSAVQLDNFSIT